MSGRQFDIVVVGAGHAGCEAAHAAARLGKQVACVTFREAHVGRLSCNPAIGGQAKGHLVREIDALGGLMGRAADATCIQFRRLNTRKGLAVQASRAQVDIDRYPAWMQRSLAGVPGLTWVYGEVADVLVAAGRVTGVRMADGTVLQARAVILTTGTFLGAVMHQGEAQEIGGRVGDRSASALSRSLTALGLKLGRLKTGTVPRLDGRTIDWDRTEPQLDTLPNGRFSYRPDPEPRLPEIVCHVTYTNEAAHEAIRAGLHRSPMYTGAIVGRGPRYCPSIEDKVVRFADRDRHLLFLEPEGLDTDRVYVNGLSTSLPAEVQDEMLKAVPGLASAQVVQYGYAVEYDFCDPLTLGPGLQHREIAGLYLAGQVNGTSGYEEAAAQGLVAGLSAGLGQTFHVKRSEGYLGVLVDDLLTKGVDGEPYRMFCSRAEHRLLLREDNADRRLMPRGRALGLVDDATWAAFEARAVDRETGAAWLADQTITPTELGASRTADAGLGRLTGRASAGELLGRPDGTWTKLVHLFGTPPPLAPEVLAELEVDAKYGGYIRHAQERVVALEALDALPIPADLVWSEIEGLSREVRERLALHRPQTLGQAGRLVGVTPAAVSLIAALLSRRSREVPAS